MRTRLPRQRSRQRSWRRSGQTRVRRQFIAGSARGSAQAPNSRIRGLPTAELQKNWMIPGVRGRFRCRVVGAGATVLATSNASKSDRSMRNRGRPFGLAATLMARSCPLRIQPRTFATPIPQSRATWRGESLTGCGSITPFSPAVAPDSAACDRRHLSRTLRSSPGPKTRAQAAADPRSDSRHRNAGAGCAVRCRDRTHGTPPVDLLDLRGGNSVGRGEIGVGRWGKGVGFA
jgi:hypothetical protein